jgi:tRNA U34 2-thiouridine synthase MnmA/TrmU
VRIRHRGALIPATIRPAVAGLAGEAHDQARPDRWTVQTDEPVWAAAPGQAAVFYDADETLGGGRIAVPAPREPRPAEAVGAVA